jgi:ABC-type nitrate/sulfonate/bicarbonate transport system substrate-binding protein
MTPLPTVRFGLVSWTATYWNLYVALDRDLYEASGLRVEPSTMGSTSQAIQRLVDGEIDVAGCSPDELVSAVGQGADLVVIGGIVNRPASNIVARPEIAQLAQLRGKRVGVNQVRGSVSIVLRAALRTAGLEVGDYQQVVAGSTPDMVEALRTGQVDAAMLTAPYDLALLDEGFESLCNVGDLFPSYAFTTLNTRRMWALDHEPEVSAFFRATRAAGAIIVDPAEREVVTGALAGRTCQGERLLTKTYETYARAGVLSRAGEVQRAGLQAVLDHMRADGLMERIAPSVDALLLPRWEAQT